MVKSSTQSLEINEVEVGTNRSEDLISRTVGKVFTVNEAQVNGNGELAIRNI